MHSYRIKVGEVAISLTFWIGCYRIKVGEVATLSNTHKMIVGIQRILQNKKGASNHNICSKTMNQAVSEVRSTVTLVKRCECYGATHLSIKLVHRFSTNVVVRRTFLILWVLDRVATSPTFWIGSFN